jgi:hypothetical protein
MRDTLCPPDIVVLSSLPSQLSTYSSLAKYQSKGFQKKDKQDQTDPTLDGSLPSRNMLTHAVGFAPMSLTDVEHASEGNAFEI